MELCSLPTEILWKILDYVDDFESRKNASLVCKSWNRIMFQSAKTLQNIQLRISGTTETEPDKQARKANSKRFKCYLEVLASSERNYVNIVFSQIFLNRTLKKFLLFVAKKFRKSIRKLSFDCHDMSQEDLIRILRTVDELEELNMHREIKRDNVLQDRIVSLSLRRMSLTIMENNELYHNLYSIAPNLEELSVVSGSHRMELYEDDPVTAIQLLDRQLHRLLNSCMSQLTVLVLKTHLNDDLLVSITRHCRALKELSLRSFNLYECHQLICLSALQGLTKLSIRGFAMHSWNELNLTRIRYLQTDSIGEGFAEFLKRCQTLHKLKLDYRRLKTLRLDSIFHTEPELQHLTLITGVNNTIGFQHINKLGNLRELRLLSFIFTNDCLAELQLPSLQKLYIGLLGSSDRHLVTDGISSNFPGLQSLAIQLSDYIKDSNKWLLEDIVISLKKQLPHCTVKVVIPK